MTLNKLIKKMDEVLNDKKLEQILDYAKTLDKKVDIKKALQKKYSNISDDDIELIATLL